VPLHLVLVGLPGCGKTVVGRAAADLLGTSFTDIDESVVREQRQSVAQTFQTHGEAHFRQLERAAMNRVLSRPPGVIAPGGGWAAQPGNLEDAVGKAVLVYMRVTPGVAAERLGDVSDRPLLAGSDVAARLSELLAQREACYRRAGHSVDTDGRTPETIAAAVVGIARKWGGW